MKNILTAAILLSFARAAFAHSPLEATIPADKEVLERAPTEVTLDFKGEIRLTRVTSSHEGQEAQPLDLGAQTSFASDFIVPFDAAEPGLYMIEWRGLGDDGHPQNGSFTFTVE